MTEILTQPEGTYWHFLRDNRCLGYRDGRMVKVGVTLKVEGQVELCCRGLHASKRVMDALYHATGSIVCLVTLGGEVLHGEDKSVAEERTALWIYDAEKLFREFACNIAENDLLSEQTAGREPDPTRSGQGDITAWMAVHAKADRVAFAAVDRSAYEAADRAVNAAATVPQRSVTTYDEEYNEEYAAAHSAAYDEAYAKANALLTSLLLTEYYKEKQD